MVDSVAAAVVMVIGAAEVVVIVVAPVEVVGIGMEALAQAVSDKLAV